MTNSRSGIVPNCQLRLVSRFWKPATPGWPGGVIWVQVEPTDTPSVGVIRLENSPAMVTTLLGTSSPVLKADIVGSDSSSATQGSSVASIAGKNRAPTYQCASACDVNIDVTMTESAAIIA